MDNTSMVSSNPAVVVARERAATERADVVVLSTGVRARVLPISPSLIREVAARVKEPPVPIWHNPDKDRDEENPNDPAYLRAVGQAVEARGQASMDAMIEFGIELVDPLPEDGRWLAKLRRSGIAVDESDPLEVEFAYKKYIAITKTDLDKVIYASGIQEAEVQGESKSVRS